MLAEGWHALVDLPSIQQAYIVKAHHLLSVDETCQQVSLVVRLRQQEIAALPVVQIGLQFVGEGRPAYNGLAGQTRFSRVASLTAHSSRAGP
jgi:hypothetical protein